MVTQHPQMTTLELCHVAEAADVLQCLPERPALERATESELRTVPAVLYATTTFMLAAKGDADTVLIIERVREISGLYMVRDDH